MSPTAIGMKKKDKCLSNGFVPRVSHCSLMIPPESSENKRSMPSTLPGIGK